MTDRWIDVWEPDLGLVPVMVMDIRLVHKIRRIERKLEDKRGYERNLSPGQLQKIIDNHHIDDFDILEFHNGMRIVHLMNMQHFRELQQIVRAI